MQLYRQVQNNVLLPTQVNGTILAADGTLSPAYLAAVQGVFASNAGCGAGSTFNPSQLYFDTPIAGVRRLYQGGSITGFITLGNLVLQPFYDETVSQAISNSPLINNPYSITLSGQQLPNVPLQRAGLVADYKAPHSAIEWLADAQYSGHNNPNNLPPYTQFDGAVNALLAKGSLTAAVTNIFNTNAGVFTSVQNAVPYYTQSGQIVPTLARPLTPRSYSVTYTVKFGPGALGNTHLAQNIAPRGGERFRGGGPGGGFRNQIAALPTSPPANPLDVSDDAAQCPADAHATAHAAFDRTESVHRADRGVQKRRRDIPATMPPPLDCRRDRNLSWHGIDVRADDRAAFSRAESDCAACLARACGAVRPDRKPRGQDARPAAARRRVPRVLRMSNTASRAARRSDGARHLYTPQFGAAFRGLQLTFMPAGRALCGAARSRRRVRESFRVYTLPSAPPKDPWEIRTAAPECTADLSNAATQAVERAARALPSGAAAASVDDLRRTRQRAARGMNSCRAIRRSSSRCSPARASPSGTPQEIVPKGWDGVMQPDLNYNAGARPVSDPRRRRADLELPASYPACARARPSRACAGARP